MNRVPLDERRQLFLARQRANQALREQMLAPSPLTAVDSSHHRRRMVLSAVMIAMLLGFGALVFQSVTFRLPTSIVEALLPGF